MDKGIFYVICSAIIIGVVMITNLSTIGQVSRLCAPKVVVRTVEVMVKPSPTEIATPTATFRRSVK